jgi:lipopolysaccharide export system protein LptC
MNARLVTIVLASLIVAVLAWLNFSGEPKPAESTDAVVEINEPDVHGEDVTFRQLRADGALHYELRAATIKQFNVENLTRMIEPDLHLLNPTQPPWDIEASLGYIRKRLGPAGINEDVVFLREQVELRQQHPQNGLVTMRSSSFYLYPDRQYAETDQDVMIDTDVGRTLAAGLVADLEKGLLKLSSGANQRVHTIVLPEQFKKS